MLLFVLFGLCFRCERKMGTAYGFVCFLGLFGTMVAASSDVFDSVLGSTASCHRSCEMTYTLHTYPKEGELYACQRGCRLFSICQFVRDGKDLNRTTADCQSTCHEAYTHVNEQYACNLGCHSQLPFAEQRHEQLEAMVPKIHLLFPLMLVRGFWEDMISQAHSFITSTWTFYLQVDDGKVVIFQFETEKDDDQDVQKMISDESSPIYKDYQRTLIQERDRDMSADRSYDDYNLFSCLSRNPRLPGWILTTTLVLSVLVLIWICCATVATAVDQYVPAEKLNIDGDRDFLTEQKLKLIPYPASSLLVITSKGPGEDEEEAGPLPPKVNLSQSDI
ncbi:transmembrane protein 59 isoform X2 [Phyllopteryx taeniolatus]|uniref:transmembrane protein 59 isoform X2 n=1 Tax=Phyllopteryx taeniolatus TaxID=161469 RepID=UPI002AD3FBFB|nr:transmembrane protein 59 isoform X2 [Phyllopteryx taeniolatus]